MITYTDHNGKAAVMSRAEVEAIERSGRYTSPEPNMKHCKASELLAYMDQRPGAVAEGERPAHVFMPPKLWMIKEKDPMFMATGMNIHLRYRSAKGKSCLAACGGNKHALTVFGFARFGQHMDHNKVCLECLAIYLDELSCPNGRLR